MSKVLNDKIADVEAELAFKQWKCHYCEKKYRDIDAHVCIVAPRVMEAKRVHALMASGISARNARRLARKAVTR